jgi:hypothetical protein
MKKILCLVMVCGLFAMLPLISATATTYTAETTDNTAVSTPLQPVDDDWTGEFTGDIGYPDRESGEPVVVGSISGTFKMGRRGGYFEGFVVSEDRSKSGEFKGVFRQRIMIGRVSGEQGTATIVGFIGFRADEQQFGGRCMAPVGPALYFWGDYLNY